MIYSKLYSTWQNQHLHTRCSRLQSLTANSWEQLVYKIIWTILQCKVHYCGNAYTIVCAFSTTAMANVQHRICHAYSHLIFHTWGNYSKRIHEFVKWRWKYINTISAPRFAYVLKNVKKYQYDITDCRIWTVRSLGHCSRDRATTLRLCSTRSN